MRSLRAHAGSCARALAIKRARQSEDTKRASAACEVRLEMKLRDMKQDKGTCDRTFPSQSKPYRILKK